MNWPWKPYTKENVPTKALNKLYAFHCGRFSLPTLACNCISCIFGKVLILRKFVSYFIWVGCWTKIAINIFTRGQLFVKRLCIYRSCNCKQYDENHTKHSDLNLGECLGVCFLWSFINFCKRQKLLCLKTGKNCQYAMTLISVMDRLILGTLRA